MNLYNNYLNNFIYPVKSILWNPPILKSVLVSNQIKCLKKILLRKFKISLKSRNRKVNIINSTSYSQNFITQHFNRSHKYTTDHYISKFNFQLFDLKHNGEGLKIDAQFCLSLHLKFQYLTSVCVPGKICWLWKIDSCMYWLSWIFWN